MLPQRCLTCGTAVPAVSVRLCSNPKPRNSGSKCQCVDLCGQDEVALGQAVDLVCPDPDADLPPAQRDVGVVRFGFGDLPDAVDKRQCGREVGELELPAQVTLVDDLPAVDSLEQRPDCVAR